MKVLFADDHAILRKGLIEILGEAYLGLHFFEASNGIEALQLIRKEPLDLILLDISMPGRNGLETLKQIRADGITTPVLILSVQPEDQYAIRVLRAGASGYLNKDSAPEELIKAVRQVMQGKKYISSQMAQNLAQSFSEPSDKPLYENLSDRELQVLQFIGKGKTVSEIAKEISLTVNTISTYRARILEKLHLHNNAELTRYAIDNHLV
ncbi:MAG: DNA-binding response regulator [Flavobacteriaceae bacterium CG_4_8_14_3_um_filter_34_10]|nr:response regulator transcription factor [Flavobacteriia bacterium]OIP49656.1 MAG: DNA-binding response regulator [Flavobacteriaceae bacterium CG2_30_34_30]PIQ19152.1 MAG: DNA-binding response regulator [Flavobacteriaceae bacterium CG18_big_fil_WC_8_21_14_2_50_34_36]PIV49316.1 MAG: DNA-binding response regulator [Flavobacteriaceae bacterium CG02_land_8_20_14_3_00_34_13]PIX08465.1 MAG: DNA-binding response regulator [Flavobacteriaceae bacterium CG_4_8_14_3_um_filter_34_10]PJC07756.1 MAG: DNA-